MGFGDRVGVLEQRPQRTLVPLPSNLGIVVKVAGRLAGAAKLTRHFDLNGLDLQA